MAAKDVQANENITKINKFHFQEALDQALDEFMKLPDEDKTPLNMQLLSRKYAPKLHKHVLDCIIENPAMLFLEAKPGFLLLDSAVATIGDALASMLMQRYQEHVNKEQAELIKAQSLRSQLSL